MILQKKPILYSLLVFLILGFGLYTQIKISESDRVLRELIKKKQRFSEDFYTNSVYEVFCRNLYNKESPTAYTFVGIKDNVVECEPLQLPDSQNKYYRIRKYKLDNKNDFSDNDKEGLL